MAVLDILIGTVLAGVIWLAVIVPLYRISTRRSKCV